MSAIKAIDEEIQQLQDRIAILRQARALLKGDAPKHNARQVATFSYKTETPAEQNKLGTVAAAARLWVHQIKGQFFVSDIYRKLYQEGFSSNTKTMKAVSAEISQMVKRGELHVVTRCWGPPGNTYIKTSELEAATAPKADDGEKLKGGLD